MKNCVPVDGAAWNTRKLWSQGSPIMRWETACRPASILIQSFHAGEWLCMDSAREAGIQHNINVLNFLLTNEYSQWEAVRRWRCEQHHRWWYYWMNSMRLHDAIGRASREGFTRPDNPKDNFLTRKQVLAKCWILCYLKSNLADNCVV